MFNPSIKGHGIIRRRLLERSQGERLPGSLLLTGPDGIGKRRVALELAQRELCFRRSACGRCEGCKPFQADPLPLELPNLLRIAPEGKAGLIRISAIREDDLVEGGVIRWAHQAPPPGCHRWILVEDAHRLNGASANMLLKILEEPPPGTHFLLVTHRPEAMLQTIRSRCERIPFSPMLEEEAWAVALEAGWKKQDRERWTALAAGTLRYLDVTLFSRAVEQTEAWLDLAEGGSFADAGGPLLPEKNAATAQSEQMAQCLELLLLVLADVARLREGKPLRLEPWRSRIEIIAKSALQLGKPMELAFSTLRHLTRNPFAESLLREVGLALKAQPA
jgi:DNA polymerase III subunit delta'